jgi:hypothetical protein
MKTLLIIAMLLTSTTTRADQMVLSKASEAEALTFLFFMCPACVVAHVANSTSDKKKEEPKKVPDTKETETLAERQLASEPKQKSK